ncbi:hypothetical protein SteCoe_37026 [Stentor coeruleus]|uniref:dual-specificity kinase n=1 Tax=Stentor coeruleus TaxID=5963 RepID=A0A1R2AP39_9CILI|nr:hypothetical protein SteCoe_37026 [Stentor coeruleus]
MDKYSSPLKLSSNTLSYSMHKSTRSEAGIMDGGKQLISRLSLNSFLANSIKPKPKLCMGNPFEEISLLPTAKDLKESFIFKEASKTVKATTKKFDLKSSIPKKETLLPRCRWEDVKIPATPNEVLKKFQDILPKWEQEEILNYNEIFYIGKNFKPKDPEFDDPNGDYKILIKDHIAFRYEIIALIGKGSFGQVLEVYDHKEKNNIALKVIKNKKKFSQQAKIEIEILEAVKSFDQGKVSNIIEIQEDFIFRNHICIAFELYSLNLYELLKRNSFKGLSFGFIKKIALQLFQSLKTLEECQIIHCDLKPENILLMNMTRPNVRLIDLGSSCYISQRLYTYIQSRFYRAPEIILGIPYTMAIDIWSLGCVLTELYTGIPIFPGENEADMLYCMMEILGIPPENMINISTRKHLYFDNYGEPKIKLNSRGRKRIPGTRSLRSILKGAEDEFFQIIEGCLKWNPAERIKPDDALKLNWLIDSQLENRKRVIRHKKISLEDVTRHVPNLQKFIAHRAQLSEN